MQDNSITRKMETLLDGGYIVQRIDEESDV